MMQFKHQISFLYLSIKGFSKFPFEISQKKSTIKSVIFFLQNAREEESGQPKLISILKKLKT